MRRSYRLDCIIRDAVIATMADFGWTYWAIGQYFGISYNYAAQCRYRHRRRLWGHRR